MTKPKEEMTHLNIRLKRELRRMLDAAAGGEDLKVSHYARRVLAKSVGFKSNEKAAR